ncbi:MAG: response regulator transcription factor [Deltaproteobacteria bacterium]|nr:response regulator transcription factor [Deltaproteobacteria bacterium]
MAARQILVIEDDKAIREGILDALRMQGFETRWAANGHTGMQAALTGEYDLLLLDLVLPGPSGLEILEALRSARPTQPVIVLTARGDESDRVRGLEMGADDYVIKPFSIKELLARIEAVLRRSAERPQDVSRIALPGGEVDLDGQQVRFADGACADLSVREAELLRYLVTNPGRVIGRDELLTRVWRVNPRRVATRTVDVHVARLREKLRDDPDSPRLIFTVRGKGYRFGEAGP